MLRLQHFSRHLKSFGCLAAPSSASNTKRTVMRYSARILLTMLVVAVGLSKSGFTQSVDPSRSPVEPATSPHPTFQDRETGPQQAIRFALGDWVGVAYFTQESDGLRLVATIATVTDTEPNTIRFVATLAPNQTASVSVPRKVGEESIQVNFVRRGERILVKSPLNTTN